uniref:beta strand repeat-containing protein n=1 Tax=Rheinheimera baltica TaxID=67576 RepID=UPI00047F1FAF
NAAELNGDVNVTISLTGTGAVAGDTLTVNGVAIVLTQAQIDAGEVLTTVTAPADGATLTVTATITDAAGNTGAEGSDSAIMDTSAPNAPGVTITEDANNDGYINAAELNGDVNVTISLTGTGAVAGDTLTVNGVAIVLTQAQIDAGEVLTTVVAPADGATLTVTATITDAAGNTGAEGSDSAIMDTTLPTLTISTVDSTLASGEQTNVTFTFSENVTGFDLSDIVVTGGTITGLVQDPNNPNVWIAVFTANGTAAISIAVANGSYTDIAGNQGAGDTAVINNAPVATNTNYTVNEDQVLVGSVLTSDVDGNTVVVQSFVINGQTYAAGTEVIIENQGTLQLNANGGFTFTPSEHWSGSLPTITYTVSDQQGGTSTAALNITVTPVADAALLQVADAVSTQVGATLITTGANGTQTGAGLSQAALEQALGLTSGFLDSFAAPSGALDDPGNIDTIDGNFTSSTANLNAGMTIGFNWRFTNGENVTSEIQQGYNDFVLVIITAPDGTQTTQLIASSELYGPSVNGSGTFNFTATQDGEYQFDWVILNGRDDGKDSQLNLSAPTIVVNGVTYGDMVDLTINAAVVDASESLSITITGIPSDALLTAGIKNADGSWTLTQEQLEGLSLLTPVGFNGQLNLTVTATTTDGASTTSVSDTLTVDVSQTTNTVLSGDNTAQTMTGTDNGDLIMAYGGNDIVNAGAGNDVVYGGLGNDTINGGSGNDVLFGGAGNDILTGGTGADVFAWQLGDQSSGTAAVDVIKDFNTAQGDVIDLRDLLQGENSDNITDYLSFSMSGGNTTINIKHTGSGNVTQQITLEGVDLSSFGSDAQAIIDSLISSGHLKIDG